jgi:hypothetical protein
VWYLRLIRKQLHNPIDPSVVKRSQKALVVLHDEHVGRAARLQREPALSP